MRRLVRREEDESVFPRRQRDNGAIQFAPYVVLLPLMESVAASFVLPSRGTDGRDSWNYVRHRTLGAGGYFRLLETAAAREAEEGG